MLFLGGARRTGKTTELVKWAEGDKHRTILVHNMPYAKQLRLQYPDIATQIDSLDNFKNNKKGFLPKTKEIAIDNIDVIIQQWFNAPVTHVTFTGGVDMKKVSDQAAVDYSKEYLANFED